MPIDFTTTPLPANGQARSATALAAIFANVRDTYNGHTNNSSPTDQHDTQAILGRSALPLTVPRTVAAQTQHFTNDMFAKAIKDIMGTANFTDAMPGTLAAIMGAINDHAIVAAPPTSIDWSLVANSNTLDINKINQNLKVIPGGSPLRTIIKGMAVYNPLTGGASPKGDQTITHPASPTAPGTYRYDGITIDSAGNAVLTVGTPSSTPAFPVLPVGQRALGMVLIAANTDSTLIPAANITDLRGGETAFGGSSGGGGSTINHPYASFGSGGDVTTPSVDLPTLLAGGYIGTSTVVNGITLANQKIDPRMIQRGTDANPLDAANFDIQADIPQRLLVNSSGSSSTATIQAGTSGSGIAGTPHNIVLWGSSGQRSRTIVANTTSPAIGPQSVGTLYLCADLTATGVSTYTLFWSTTSALAQYQCVLAEFMYDGSANLYWRSSGGNYVVEEYGGLGTIDAQRVKMNRIALATANVDSQTTLSSSAYAVPANCPRVNFEIMEPKLFVAFWRATITIGNNCTSGQKIYMGVAIDDDSTVVYNQYAPYEFTVPTFTGVSVTGFGTEVMASGADVIALSPGSNASGLASRVHTAALYNLSTLTSVSVFGRSLTLIPFAQ